MSGYPYSHQVTVSPPRRTSTAHLVVAWVVALFTVFYMLPWAVTATRNKSNTRAIALINVFLGWSLIGWVVALVMACSAESYQPQVVAMKNHGFPAYPVQGYAEPATQYPANQYPITQYPIMQYPIMQYPITQYPSSPATAPYPSSPATAPYPAGAVEITRPLPALSDPSSDTYGRQWAACRRSRSRRGRPRRVVPPVRRSDPPPARAWAPPRWPGAWPRPRHGSPDAAAVPRSRAP